MKTTLKTSLLLPCGGVLSAALPPRPSLIPDRVHNLSVSLLFHFASRFLSSPPLHALAEHPSCHIYTKPHTSTHSYDLATSQHLLCFANSITYMSAAPRPPKSLTTLMQKGKCGRFGNVALKQPTAYLYLSDVLPVTLTRPWEFHHRNTNIQT